MFTEIPLFDGKTSLDLMLHVRKLILDEPNRILMDIWGIRLQGDAYDEGVKDKMTMNHGRNFPSCGTVACLNGWMDYSMGKYNTQPYNALSYLPESTKNEARALFGGSCIIDYEIDDFIKIQPYPFPCPFSNSPEEYAQAVAENIDKFIERNREALEAHII